jgi:predicted DsbA family dithiol-disulfide isomerase
VRAASTTRAVRQALADGRYAGAADFVTREAREDEVLSTPTFVFQGGFRLTGAQDYDVFASVTRRLMKRRMTKRESS